MLGFFNASRSSRNICNFLLLGFGILVLIFNRLGNRRLANFSGLVLSAPNERSHPHFFWDFFPNPKGK